MSTQTLPRKKGMPKKPVQALLALTVLLAFSSIASAAQFDLVFNARSTGVIDFNTVTERDEAW